MDIIREGQSIFDLEIEELEKVKKKMDSSFEKLVNEIYSMGENKVVVTGIGTYWKKNISDFGFNWDFFDFYECSRGIAWRFGNDK